VKTCGTCSLCCKVLQIEPLAKPAGQWCAHVRKGMGCGVYQDRPTPCRVFTCGWLARDDLDESWKPERCRFLIRDENQLGQLCIDVDPGLPNAWRQDPYYSRIKQWSKAIWTLSVCVVVYAGDRNIVVFPEEDLEIDALGQGEQLRVGYRRIEGRQRPMVQFLEGDQVTRERLGQTFRMA